MNVADVERLIGVPTEDWEGNCFGIATRMVECGLVEGKVCYGMWLGPIVPGTVFADRPFTHHAWIETWDKKIVDPTRWVFEGRQPYIHEGPNNDPLYDLGSGTFRERLNLPTQPWPAWNPEEKRQDVLQLSDAALTLLYSLSGAPPNPEPRTFTIDQLFWIANKSPQHYGDCAEEIYQSLIDVGQTQLIPIDYRNYFDLHDHEDDDG